MRGYALSAALLKGCLVVQCFAQQIASWSSANRRDSSSEPGTVGSYDLRLQSNSVPARSWMASNLGTLATSEVLFEGVPHLYHIRVDVEIVVVANAIGLTVLMLILLVIIDTSFMAFTVRQNVCK